MMKDMINRDDYYFRVKWTDQKGKDYSIGVLARIDDKYYFRMPRNTVKVIPGFLKGRIYVSDNELFQFFKERVYTSDASQDIMQKLKETGGRSYRDSYHVEEIPERFRKQYKDVLESMEYNYISECREARC